MMQFADTAKRAAARLAIASLISANLSAQIPKAATGFPAPSEIAQPLPEDRGVAAFSQSLKRLATWASLMMIVAHPDDEDGAMLTYESRGQGVRASLLTLTRGEGGQNAVSSDSYDALGIIRTNELLRAGQYYGVQQYWGTEADFGFSKTQEESFARWSHQRVLCDTILAVRRERPLVLTSSFVGGLTDGHGHHQVSGEISQEAYLDAGDPKVCPEQIAAGIAPWSPLKVYARIPFARVTDKGMFDYATGKWAPVRFYSYVTKEWTTAAPTSNVEIPEGDYDPVLGRTYVQIAREGWGEQKSQYGGGNPVLSGDVSAGYHLYGSRAGAQKPEESSFFDGIPTGIGGLTSLLAEPAPSWLTDGLGRIAADVNHAQRVYSASEPDKIAPALKEGYLATESLVKEIGTSKLSDSSKISLLSELNRKEAQFQTALAQSLGLDLQAFTVRTGSSPGQNGPFGGGVEESPASVYPGQPIQVRVHTGNATGMATLSRVWLEGSDDKDWNTQPTENPSADAVVKAVVPADAQPTEPPFSRPSIEQAYYDLFRPEFIGLSFAPYPLAAWAEFSYDGVPVRIGEVVQTMQRVPGRGGSFQPLVVTPQIGVLLDQDARILPVGKAGSPLPIHVTVHTEGAAEGQVNLRIPKGWQATPASAAFKRTRAGDAEPILFEVTPASSTTPDAEYKIDAEATSGGKTYATGWHTIGYPGIRSYNLYRKAEMKTRAIDVKVAPGLRVAYVMGTGDTVPDAIEDLGIPVHLLSTEELAFGDLSAWDTIVVGIRAYSNRPELAAAQSRLDAFVENGGTLIVQYQTSNFPAPYPLKLGSAEKVVEETTPVKLLVPDAPLLTWPNRITTHDFDGWVEERGHSFLDSWDPAYTALTETADAGQDPQRGGLLVAHPGKGTYIYDAYALYRQLSELVPGSYRLFANLLSAGKGDAH